eukprot:CAMPEP_0203747488 /NCGR_PEP_ID=MMETSP0098-20131031/2606_1 /ASSEMBLY_ACC=CAM_ASM_000208 /TAXON_ID=96639 /ORGANISM=" , Strain NY0313808BC1" /LENGTH=1136 /DNA_ID=CAMNT_0050635915 /DNA_START=145 /DNA_END=3555 /DNA_ORIENTATION=+
MSSFEDAPERLDFPGMEEEVLKFWEETNAFERSVEMSKDKPEYTFYDGPPFATGLPHYGHILAGTIKDIVTRYASLTGFHVSRRFGWDCHGLPIEYEIDKKLGITSSDDVAKMGIRKYNEECRSIVTRYCGEWETIVKRMGRWIDFKNDYKTMEPWYMESVWWVFKTIFEKDLVYKGFRVMPYSYGCTTPLSNFEATSNYKDVTDPAVVVSFPLVDEPDVSLVIWTTTPWTLPSNLGVCVNPTFDYVQIKDIASGKQYIIANALISELYPKMKKQKEKYKGGEFEIVKSMKGTDLKGKRYVPLFDYYKDHPNAFQVLNDEYVTDDSGTGLVHQAPAFGEDDYRVCMAAGVIVAGGELPCPVDDDGRFTEKVPDFVGRNVKEADNDICKMLKAKGRLVSKNSILHSYPFCWRSDTPLLYRAVPSWFVKLDPIKEQLLKNNTQTYWVPEVIKTKRFHNWLEGARDWNISRNRYWGTPLPVWTSEDGEEVVVIGSIQELQELSGKVVTDLHRENVDDIEIPSKQGKGMLRRIPEVFDCWFESGSMPYAQQHYPFENKERFENGFPADFIAEGLDQTRGWFYTLMVLSTALFDKPAFKNLIVNGLVLANDGKKMSKRLKNYPDPMEVVHKYGADSLRLYLINSPIVRGEPLRFREEGVLQNLKEIFLPWYNTYRFFVQNALRLDRDQGSAFDKEGAEEIAKASTNFLDKWFVAALQNLILFFRKEMAAYRLYTVVPRLISFIEQMTNCYVRLNRNRLKGLGNTPEDTNTGLCVLYVVLLDLSKLMAPFTPYFADYLYQKLAVPKTEDESSVHFMTIPEADTNYINEAVERSVGYMQEVITTGRLARGDDIPLKRPVREMIIAHEDTELLESMKVLEPYIKGELNIQSISYSTDEEKFIKLHAVANGQTLGRKLGKKFAAVNKAVKALTHKELVAFQKAGKLEVEGVELSSGDVFFNRSLADNLKEGLVAKVSSSNLTVVLDTFLDAKMVGEQISREFVNRVQKLRKNSGVQVGEVFDIYYGFQGSDAAFFESSIEENKESVFSTLRCALSPMKDRPTYAQAVGEIKDEVTIDGMNGEMKTVFHIALCIPCISIPQPEKLAELLGIDVKAATAVRTCVSSMNFDWIKSNASDSMQVTVCPR